MLRAIGLVATLALLLAACGSKPVADIKVTLGNKWQTIRAEPPSSPEHGKIKFDVTNQGAGAATFAIHKDSQDLGELDLKSRETNTLTVTMDDGTYELACETAGKVTARTPFEVK